MYAYADDLAIMLADGRLAGSGRGAQQKHGIRKWIPPDLDAKAQHYKNGVGSLPSQEQGS